MANPQKENGFTPIAHEILLALAQINLNGYERRYLDILFLKTYGWNKKKDWVSNSQFVALTGIQKSHVARSQRCLLQRKIVAKLGNKLMFNKHYEEWLDKDFKTPLKVTILGNSVAGLGNNRCLIRRTQKKQSSYTQQTSMKKNKIGRYREDQSSDSFEPEVDITSGEPKIDATSDFRRVGDKDIIFACFAPKKEPWMFHAAEREAALRLFDLKGLEQVRKAMVFVRQNRSDPFCPVINRPFELEQKWDSLLAYRERNK